MLVGFTVVSRLIPGTRAGFPADFPPLFIRWDPMIGWRLAAPVVLGIALVAVYPRLSKARPRALLATLVAFCWLFAVTLAVQSLPDSHYPRLKDVSAAGIIARPYDRPSEYYSAVPIVQELGPRAFASDYPQLNLSGALPLHATTHPPGGPLLLWVLWSMLDRSRLAVAIATALIGALGVLPTYAIALEVKGRKAARSAAFLFACSPGLLIYSVTSMDVVFMTVFACCVAAIVRERRAP